VLRIKRSAVRIGRFTRSVARLVVRILATAFFKTMPFRWSFALLVIADACRMASAHWLTRRYVPVATMLMIRNQNVRFSSTLSDLFPVHAARVLFWIGGYREGVDVLDSLATMPRSHKVSFLMSQLLFELGQFERARNAIDGWYSSPALLYQKALLQLLAGNESDAVPPLVSATIGQPHLTRPHQNLATRDSQEYTPNSVDRAAGSLGNLYDAYNFIGQRVTHVGAGDLGARLFAGALRIQRSLELSRPKLSLGLQTTLAALGISPEELRVLPPEWTIQIGHQGMIDILLRMRDLGWWKGKPVLLAEYSKIANHAMLSLFEESLPILVSDGRGYASPLAELSSLQRYCGMSINAFELPSGEVVPWQEAGAMAIRQWETEGRSCPLRDQYDRHLDSLDTVRTTADRARVKWGMGPDDWYVCLHLRDSSHYEEAEGSGQTHRNAQISSYLPAIEHIARQGGWVIKLGGPASPQLPRMERVVDYARSKFKSDVMDLHLIRHARYFVGTTSGLTNVAVSFGVPCALVNCVTVDAQLWGKQVRFILKSVVNQDGRMLTQRELTSAPWRWRVFSAETMMEHRIVALQNSADEVLQIVKEVELLACTTSPATTGTAAEDADLLERWRATLSLPHFYGGGLPSLYYLRKHEPEFLAG
jgi:putative glycosyltransferase (TIGR04372 family)